MLYYCKKCGRTILLYDNDEKHCDYCSNTVLPVPEEYRLGNVAIKKDREEEFIEKYIKSSPEFEQYLFDHRDEDLDKQRMQYRALLDEAKAAEEEKSRVPRCPICQSTNLSRLSSLGKAAKLGIFGLYGADDLGKTYKCNHCGSKF